MHARKAKLKTHLVTAKAKVKQHVTSRRVLLLAAAACSASLLLLTMRTLQSAAARTAAGTTDDSSPAAVVHDNSKQHQQRDCVTVPVTVAAALVHYATTNETPPLTEPEAGAAARVLARRAPCNLLVFGLDAGSALWPALNRGGRTLFLDAEDDRIAAARAARPAGIDIEAHHVAYQERATSLASDADELISLRDSPECTGPAVASPAKPLSPDFLERSPCRLAPRGLPATLFDADWDVIVVNDASVASAVYAAGVAARARRPDAGETDVVVHGVDSPAEERFARAFLCEGYVKEEAGRTRHFAVPSHRNKEAMLFCP